MDPEQEARPVLDKLTAENFCERINAKDGSLWTTQAAPEDNPSKWLGWMDIAAQMEGKVAELKRFVLEVRDAGYVDAVLLGMGGSSLAPEVMRRTFAPGEGYPTDGYLRLHVLDTTDPATILAVEEKIDPAHTLFIVSSKSGSTIEPNSLYAYFRSKVEAVVGAEKAGQRFVAVTDPGTSLERLAGEQGFRHVFHGEPTIGGRYSALSYFGLVPAALIGVDISDLLERAQVMARMCYNCDEHNDGLKLGAVMGWAWQQGRDKVTLVLPPPMASFGLWAEQLIAESTGKQGKGIVPVAGEPLGSPQDYGNDRLFVCIGIKGLYDCPPEIAALEQAGQPVYHINVDGVYALGAEFYRWEYATAVAGSILGINAFDQPNVTESKNNTNALLKQFIANSKLPAEQGRVGSIGPLTFYIEGGQEGDAQAALRSFLASIKPGDYACWQAYIPYTDANETAIDEPRLKIRDHYKVAITFGFGPRFLHSTGQLHKGGANNGVFIQITADDPQDVPILGQPYGFSTLKRAQSQGDFQSLNAHGRRAIHIHISGDLEAGLTVLRGLDWEA